MVVKRDKKSTLHTVCSMHLVVSGTDIGYSSQLSSPPLFCIRLGFRAFITTLFVYFLQLHPYMQLFFNKNIFYPSNIRMWRGKTSTCTSTFALDVGWCYSIKVAKKKSVTSVAREVQAHVHV